MFCRCLSSTSDLQTSAGAGSVAEIGLLDGLFFAAFADAVPIALKTVTPLLGHDGEPSEFCAGEVI